MSPFLSALSDQSQNRCPAASPWSLPSHCLVFSFLLAFLRSLGPPIIRSEVSRCLSRRNFSSPCSCYASCSPKKVWLPDSSSLQSTLQALARRRWSLPISTATETLISPPRITPATTSASHSATPAARSRRHATSARAPALSPLPLE